MKTTPFTRMASLFRGHIVKLWALTQTDSPSVVAEKLTAAALTLGFIVRTRPVPGTSLTEWALKPETTPYWAAQTALTLMLESGWVPVSSVEWCGTAALFYRINKQSSLDELLQRLPSVLDKSVAAGWLAAAIEEDAFYRSGGKTR